MILESWKRHVDCLLNNGATALEPSITDEVERTPIVFTLGDTLTLQKVRGALGMIANGKAMGPDEVPKNLLKLGIRENQIILWKFDDVIVKV